MKRLNTDIFIRNCSEIHNNKYDYSKTIYTTSRKKVLITCKKHGDFSMTANSHAQGSGCRICFLENKSDIISRAVNIKKIKSEIPITDIPNTKLIPLTKGRFALVDACVYDELISINWSYNGRYAINSKAGLMHVYIAKTPKGYVTDHINGNGIDNRRDNLRICTQSQNMANVPAQKNKTSKYKGVYFNKKENRWYSQIKNKKEHFFLGSFTNQLEAAKAYDAKAIVLFGEFARLNFKYDDNI